MKKKTNNSERSFVSILLRALPVIGVCVGVFLIVLSFIKTAEFKKTEKIEVTFTEPVVSVRWKGKDVDNDMNEYEIRVDYTYNGEEKTYTFTERTEKNHSSYKVGDMKTFTKYFSPDGTETTDVGVPLRIVGFVLFFVSLPWLVFFIFTGDYHIKKRKS